MAMVSMAAGARRSFQERGRHAAGVGSPILVVVSAALASIGGLVR